VNAQYLLDTNVVSEPLRPVPNARVLALLKRKQDQLAIASIVWHELWFGCRRLPVSARRTAIERYLTEVISASMVVLPYGRDAAEWHAAERARLAAAGKTPPFADGQIAAIAFVNNLTLVTLNSSDYAAFAGVKVVDWRQPGKQ
jgi:tRNA(fMet)-specific endonuclease VapC